MATARSATLKWLRKTHGWLGLWGATLGLLFGITGILQDHRAILKISLPKPQESNVQLPLPNPQPADADALATWLQMQLAMDRAASRIKSEPPKEVIWHNQAVQQPARWTMQFSAPQFNTQVDYWVGNNFVTLKRSDNDIWATLINLHKANGVGPGWILLADSVAGSIILLSLSGIAMWILTHRKRTIGLLIVGVSTSLAIGFAWLSL